MVLFDIRYIPSRIATGGEDVKPTQFGDDLRSSRLLRIARIVKFIENSNFLQSRTLYTNPTPDFSCIDLCSLTGCLFYFVCVLRKSGFGSGPKVVMGR